MLNINKKYNLNNFMTSRHVTSRHVRFHFKLFSSLCLLINYKILFYLFVKNLFKFFFEFIKFQFAKSIYLFKCFNKYLLNGYNNPKGFLLKYIFKLKEGDKK